MVVSKSDDGRVMVLADDLPGGGAVRVKDVWSENGIPSADDLKDNFTPVEGREAETLFQEALAALSSNPSLLRDP